MICKNCGRELPENAQFCAGCGAVQQDAAATQNGLPKQKKNPALIILIAVLSVLLLAGIGLLVHRAVTGVWLPWENTTQGSEESGGTKKEKSRSDNETPDADKTTAAAETTTVPAATVAETTTAVIEETSSVTEPVTAISGHVQIPNVINRNYSEAQTILESMGFKVELLQTAGDPSKENTVAFTNPNAETYALYGSTVYVYYVSSAAGPATTAFVPDVIGDSAEEARQKILAAGLKLGGIQYDASTEALKDRVLGQNPAGGESVNTGTFVYITVGNGAQDAATATVRITLPDISSSRKATVTTQLNNAAYDTIPNVTLDGSELAVSFTGVGADNTFAVYVDNTMIYSGKIDFTGDRDKVYDVARYTFTALGTVPNVIGMTEAQALAALNDAGFTDISVESVNESGVASGVVASQSPASSELTQYRTDIHITIYVSTGN